MTKQNKNFARLFSKHNSIGCSSEGRRGNEAQIWTA